MAHIRPRYLEPLIQKGLRFKGLVGIFGHRQVGKTTLLEKFAKTYTTLDLPREIERAESNPEGFVEELCQNPKLLPAAIDECQMVPKLFPVLKDLVRRKPNPGLFLLSGSVRFSSRKAIRESLTGRLLTYELLPFSISELNRKPLNTLALELMTADFQSWNFEKLRCRGLPSPSHPYLITGGLPGICFVRDAQQRSDLIDAQLNLILDRDLRLVCDTSLSVQRLRILLRVLAENQNRPVNFTELKRKTHISEPTLKKVILGLESIFMLRTLPTEGEAAHPVLFFEDQGEATHLANGRYDSFIDLERLAFAHLRIPFSYEAGIKTECFQYRTRGGAYVPFAFRRGERVLGFICSLEKSPPLGAIRSAQSFRDRYPRAKIVYLHPGKESKVFSSNEVALPVELFL